MDGEEDSVDCTRIWRRDDEVEGSAPIKPLYWQLVMDRIMTMAFCLEEILRSSM